MGVRQVPELLSPRNRTLVPGVSGTYRTRCVEHVPNELAQSGTAVGTTCEQTHQDDEVAAPGEPSHTERHYDLGQSLAFRALHDTVGGDRRASSEPTLTYPAAPPPGQRGRPGGAIFGAPPAIVAGATSKGLTSGLQTMPSAGRVRFTR